MFNSSSVKSFGIVRFGGTRHILAFEWPMGLDFSPVRGPEGNIEYLAYLKKGAFEAPIPDAAAVVAASHRELAK